MNTTDLGLPRRWLVLLLAALPAASLVLSGGASVISLLLVLTAPLCWRPGAAAWRRVPPLARLVLAAFALHAALALSQVLWRGDPLSNFERPLRMLAAGTAMLLVLAFRPPSRALWVGAIGAGVAGLLLIGWQRFGLGMERPGGPLNAITFADLAVSCGLICVAAGGAGRRWIWGAGLGALAAFAGAVLTGTRGAWAGLLLAVLSALCLAPARGRRLAAFALALGLAIGGAGYLAPHSPVQERVQEAAHDIGAYREGFAYTRLGMRFELWRAGWDLAVDHPLRGYTEAEREQAMARLVQQGVLDKGVLTLPHLHNDALQALVNGGIPGLLTWLATLLTPAAFFVQSLRGRGGFAALAGLFTVAAFLGFGLTEVIFWSVNACLYYSLLVFMLMGLAINANDDDE